VVRLLQGVAGLIEKMPCKDTLVFNCVIVLCYYTYASLLICCNHMQKVAFCLHFHSTVGRLSDVYVLMSSSKGHSLSR
jgi:hypothetical protein